MLTYMSSLQLLIILGNFLHQTFESRFAEQHQGIMFETMDSVWTCVVALVIALSRRCTDSRSISCCDSVGCVFMCFAAASFQFPCDAPVGRMWGVLLIHVPFVYQ